MCINVCLCFGEVIDVVEVIVIVVVLVKLSCDMVLVSVVFASTIVLALVVIGAFDTFDTDDVLWPLL